MGKVLPAAGAEKESDDNTVQVIEITRVGPGDKGLKRNLIIILFRLKRSLE